jgi:hypothetical protein
VQEREHRVGVQPSQATPRCIKDSYKDAILQA